VKKRQRIGSLAAAIAVSALSWGVPGHAEEAAKAEDEGGKITYSGFLDFYYQYAFTHPPTGTNLTGRAFDIKNDQFGFAVLQVNVNRAPSEKLPVGFTISGTVGKNADLVHFSEPGGPNTYKYLQQAYATYVAGGGKHPVTIDFGKWATLHGYEVIESANNDNYSRGLLFTYAIPLYHMGVRASVPLTPKLSAGIQLVNGWNNVEDDNGGKSYGAMLNFAATPTLNFVLNYMGGDEGGPANTNGAFGGIAFPTATVLNVQLLDFVANWTPSPKFKLGVNVDYASASKPGATGGNWNGQAVYLKYALSSKNNLALRLEHFEDSNGLRTGTAQNLNGITATLDHSWKPNVVTKLEFRHDHAGTKLYPSGGGGGNDQDTISLSQVVKF
jgi:hypothetical protein